MPGADFSALQPDPKQVFQKAARKLWIHRNVQFGSQDMLCSVKKCISGFLICYLLSDGTIWTTISPNIFHPDMVCSFENLKKNKKNKTDFKGLRSEDELFYSEVVKMDFVSFNTFIAPHWSWTVLRASIWARTIINTVHMRVKPNPVLCFLLQRFVLWSFTHSLTVSVGSLRPLARLLDSLALTRLHCLGEVEGRARDLLMLLQLLGCW